MTELVLRGWLPDVLASHLGLLGLMGIVEDELPGRALTVHWTGDLDTRPVLRLTGAGPDEVAAAVARHGRRLSGEGAWAMMTLPDEKGVPRGLMSPQRALPGGTADEDAWDILIRERRAAIDGVRRIGDLRMLGGLGEPSFWHQDRTGRSRPERGASILDMQPRNHGSELFRNRVQKIAPRIAAMSPDALLSALIDPRIDAETDLTAPGFTLRGQPWNAASSWCALWGLAALPVVIRGPDRASRTTGVTESEETVMLPVFRRPARPARVRAVVADARCFAAASSGDGAGKASSWLHAHGVGAIAVFRIRDSGSGRARLREAELGHFIPLKVGGGASGS